MKGARPWPWAMTHGHHPDGSHSQGEGGPSGHQQHHTQRRDQQLTDGAQGLPQPGQLIKQSGEERRVGVAGQQGGADVLGDQRPAPDAPWLQG